MKRVIIINQKKKLLLPLKQNKYKAGHEVIMAKDKIRRDIDFLLSNHRNKLDNKEENEGTDKRDIVKAKLNHQIIDDILNRSNNKANDNEKRRGNVNRMRHSFNQTNNSKIKRTKDNDDYTIEQKQYIMNAILAPDKLSIDPFYTPVKFKSKGVLTHRKIGSRVDTSLIKLPNRHANSNVNNTDYTNNNYGDNETEANSEYTNPPSTITKKKNKRLLMFNQSVRDHDNKIQQNIFSELIRLKAIEERYNTCFNESLNLILTQRATQPNII